MHRLKQGLFAAMVALLMLAGGVVAAQNEGTDAQVRFVHVVPGAAAIDIYVNNQLVVSNLDFGQATEYINVPSGTHSLSVTPAGLTTVLAGPQEVTVGAGKAITLVASSSDPLTFTGYEEVLTALPLGKARLTAIHAIADGPTVDVLLPNGTAAFDGLTYNNTTLTSFDLDLNFTWTFAVAPDGGTLDQAIIPATTLPLTSGTSYMVIVYGTATRPFLLLLANPATSEGENGYVRVAHGVPGGVAVDVFVEMGETEQRIVSGLTFEGSGTEYIPVPAGTYTVNVRESAETPSPEDEVLAEAELTVEAGQYQTVVALAADDALTLVPFVDDLSASDADTAVVNVINGVNGSTVGFTLGDAALLEGVEFARAAAASFDAAAGAAAVSVDDGAAAASIDLTENTYYGGVYYNFVVVSGEEGAQVAALNPVGVAQGLTSAPGEGALTVAEPTSAEVVALPTLQPTTDAGSSEVVAAQPTQPPVAPAQSDFPTAVVVGLDPGANLRLREYPPSWIFDANTLHLIPTGTALRVIGREGPAAYGEGIATATPRPEATAFADPAELLEDRDDDLDPLVTWINVLYETPDGGTITAWVSAQYLQITGTDGEEQRLADLPLVPVNSAGELSNTSITPPPPPEDIVTAVVTGVEATANVNLRRTPSTDGEVLASLPGGTVLSFLGILEDRSWVYAVYTPTQGGSISGWVSAAFITYQWNGRDINLDEMEIRDLLVIASGEEIGQVGVGTVSNPVTQATRSPARDAFVITVRLDPGANLNLRRTPSTQGEVIAQIPSETQLVVIGRTTDELWFEVEFEGQRGWVTSDPRFSVLTFNGRSAAVTDVPVSLSAPSGTGTPAPTQPVTATPTATP